MDNKLYKAKQEAKKQMERAHPDLEEKVKAIRKKSLTSQNLTFAERNILKIHSKKMDRLIKSSLK